jgi:hypothetical protein
MPMHLSSRSRPRSIYNIDNTIRILPLQTLLPNNTNSIQDRLEPTHILLGHVRMKYIPFPQSQTMWQDVSVPEEILEGVGVGREGSLIPSVAGGEGVEVWEFD